MLLAKDVFISGDERVPPRRCWRRAIAIRKEGYGAVQRMRVWMCINSVEIDYRSGAESVVISYPRWRCYSFEQIRGR